MQTDRTLKKGVIEGFFGRPWDWSARLSYVNCMHDLEFQFYIYAPKADAFLRRRWREPMPSETLQHLSELSARCQDRGVSLGVGLTPFEIYLNYDAEARKSLRSKVEQINAIRADILCILFDDMRGDINGLPEIQTNVISDICDWSTAQHFIVCPTYYSYDLRLTREFGPPPKTYLKDFGRLLDPSIDVFWTGEKVISDGYSRSHVSNVAADLGRKPFIWDNHTSNDSKIRTNYLFLDPSAGAWKIPADLIAGLAINPMNQPHLSRIALCGYQRMLKGSVGQPGAHVMSDICQKLCGPLLAEHLIDDSALFQTTGLSQMADDTRRRLLDYYGAGQADPYAQEIAAWLRGEYVFDPQCLTT